MVGITEATLDPAASQTSGLLRTLSSDTGSVGLSVPLPHPQPGGDRHLPLPASEKQSGRAVSSLILGCAVGYTNDIPIAPGNFCFLLPGLCLL